EQMALWDSGDLAVMHTSPDHLLRERQRDPVAVRAEGLGDLTVYATESLTPETRGARWGVDGLDSAFAFVLRAVLEQVGFPIPTEMLVPIGGTLQRVNALSDGTIDGTTLHAPFDHMAEAAGFRAIGRHLDVVPDLTTVVLVVSRADTNSNSAQKYVEVTDRARAELLASGPGAVAEVLVRQGWSEPAAFTAGTQVCSVAGLDNDSRALERGLTTAVELRRQFAPDRAAAPDIKRFI